MEIPTLRVAHPDQPGQVMIINATDYDPAVHTLLEGEGGASTGDTGGSGTQNTEDDLASRRADRAEDLEAMSATEVREVAEAAGLELTNKAENIARILAHEFPEG